MFAKLFDYLAGNELDVINARTLVAAKTEPPFRINIDEQRCVRLLDAHVEWRGTA